MSLEFTNTSEYVSVTDSADFTISNNFTICFWAYRNDVNRNGIASHTNVSDATTGWWLDILNTTHRIQFTFNDTDYFSNNDAAPDTATWYHLAVTYNGSTLQFYKDAVAHGSTAVSDSVNTPGANLLIGKDLNNYGETDGDVRIQDFRIYPGSVLNSTNLAAILDGSEYGTPGGWWNFTTSIATDLSGNNNNGTVNGTPSDLGDPGGWSWYTPPTDPSLIAIPNRYKHIIGR